MGGAWIQLGKVEGGNREDGRSEVADGIEGGRVKEELVGERKRRKADKSERMVVDCRGGVVEAESCFLFDQGGGWRVEKSRRRCGTTARHNNGSATTAWISSSFLGWPRRHARSARKASRCAGDDAAATRISVRKPILRVETRARNTTFLTQQRRLPVRKEAIVEEQLASQVNHGRE